MLTHYEQFMKTMTNAGKRLMPLLFSREAFEKEIELMSRDAERHEFDSESYPLFSMIQGNMIEDHGTHVSPSADVQGVLEWVRDGKKVYRLSEGLTSELSATDISGIWKYIRTPFKTIYIQPGVPLMEVTGKSIVNPSFVDKIVGYYLTEKDSGLSIIAVAIADNAKPEEMHSWIHVHVKKEWMIEDQPINLESTLDEFEKDPNVQAGTDMDYNRDLYREILTFPLNVLLYLCSDRPEVSAEHTHGQEIIKAMGKTGKSKKLRALEKQLSEISTTLHHDVGRSIKVDRSVPVNRNPLSTGRHFKFSYRFHVNGHWRWQKVGPGKIEIKHVRVRPYFKGPDMAEVIHKQYEVEKKA